MSQPSDDAPPPAPTPEPPADLGPGAGPAPGPKPDPEPTAAPPALADAAAAFERGDFAAARAALAGAPPAEAPGARALAAQLRRGLDLDGAIWLTGLGLLALWCVLFFASVR